MSDELNQQPTAESTVTESATSTPDTLGDAGLEALRKEREERARIEKELKLLKSTYADIDPNVARKAQEVLKKAQEQEEARAKYEAELQAKYESEYKPQVEAANKQAVEARNQLLAFKQEVAWQQAYESMKGIRGEFIAVKNALMQFSRVDDKGNIVILDAEGKPAYIPDDKGQARPMKAEELIADLLKKEEYTWFARHFEGSNVGGLGLNGSGSGGLSIPGYDKLPAWKQVELQREQQSRR